MAKKETIDYKDLKEIKKVFEKQNGDKKIPAIALIDEAIFCGETLEKLKEKVNSSEIITTMCQGNYSIERENPALKSYNTTIKNYQALIKQITDLLQQDVDNKNSKAGESLLGFVASGKK